MVARFVRDEMVGGSNPLTPTLFRVEPFDEHIEGFSRLWAGVWPYADWFKQCLPIGRKRPLSGRLLTGFELATGIGGPKGPAMSVSVRRLSRHAKVLLARDRCRSVHDAGCTGRCFGPGQSENIARRA